MNKNMLIAQSGGPTAVINASLAGAIKAAQESGKVGTIYGAIHGIEGILKDRIIDAGKYFSTAEDFEKLIRTPSMALGSCRFKLSKTVDENYQKIVEILTKYEIGYFLYIGGNDSMDTVDKLSTFIEKSGLEVKCIGIPKTIDNDLVVTDHTPGFPSAARYVANSMAEIYADTCVYDRPMVTVVEIMGRNAGWLTASSIMARRSCCPIPQLIYLPEIPFDFDSFEEDIKEAAKEHTSIVVAVSEGIKFKSGEYVTEAKKTEYDSFGHAALSGVGRYLGDFVKEKFGYKTRVIEFSLLQRAASHLTSYRDVEEARICGEKAVEYALDGMNRVMVSMKRVSSDPYLIEYEPVNVSEIANKEKQIPMEWIKSNGHELTDEFIEYVRPLIADEEGGIVPDFFLFDKTDCIVK